MGVNHSLQLPRVAATVASQPLLVVSRHYTMSATAELLPEVADPVM